MRDTGKETIVFPEAENITNVELEMCEGNQLWLNYTPEEIYKGLSTIFGEEDVAKISRQFGELRLRISTNKHKPNIQWHYNPFLGVFNEI